MIRNWNQYYELAKEYYLKHGNLLIKCNYVTEDGFELGKWIADQRKYNNAGELKQERIDKLNEIGMIWSVSEYKWYLHYEEAKEYYKKHNNLLVPQNYKTESGFGLGVWIVIQRQRKDNLNEKQIKLLEEIKMVWEVNDHLWNEHYKKAKEYYLEHGDLLVPCNYVTPDGFNLGIWLNSQRQAYKGIGTCKLNKEQIKLLDEIKMIWDLREYKWYMSFKAVKKYYLEHGNLNIPNNLITEDGIHLRNWLDYLKYSNNLSEDKKELLKEIGYDFEKLNDKNWNFNYNLAKLYFEKYGNLRIPYNFKTKDGISYDEDGAPLGQWITTQRRCYREKKLSQEKIDLLNKIGMVWEIDKEKKVDDMSKRIWNNNFELVKKYYYKYEEEVPKDFNTFNGVDKDIRGKRIGKWVQFQKDSYKGVTSFKLTDEMIVLLESTKIDWFGTKDEKYQKQEIKEKNKKRKEIEILNRFRSVLLSYDGNTLPSKEEINDKFIKQLKI